MGTLALCNLINVLVIFAPSIVCIDDRVFDICMHRCRTMKSSTKTSSRKWFDSCKIHCFSCVSVLICLLLSGFACWLAATNFRITQQLLMWPEDLNLGRRYIENFQTSRPEELDRSLQYFQSSGEGCETNISSCPLGSSNDSFCSQQGDCDTRIGICECYVGHVGLGCSREAIDGNLQIYFDSLMKAPKGTYKYVYVLSPMYDTIPSNADVHTFIVTLANGGDTEVDWALRWSAAARWISVASSVVVPGKVAVRYFDRSDRYYQGTTQVELNVSLHGLPSNWSGRAELTVTSSTPGVEEQSLAITALVTRPPSLDNLRVFPTLAEKPANMSLIFDSRYHASPGKEGQNLFRTSSHVIYEVSVPYEVDYVKVHTNPPDNSTAAQIHVENNQVDMTAEGVSQAIQLPKQWPRLLNITVLVVSAEMHSADTTYTLQVKRADPSWSLYVQGSLTLNVSNCTELNNSDGRSDLANGIATAAAVDVGMLYKVDVLCFSNFSGSAEVRYVIQLPPGYNIAGVKANLEYMMANLPVMLATLISAFRSGLSEGAVLITAVSMGNLAVDVQTTTVVTTTRTKTATSSVTSSSVTSSTASTTTLVTSSVTTSTGSSRTSSTQTFTATSVSITPTTTTTQTTTTPTTTTTLTFISSVTTTTRTSSISVTLTSSTHLVTTSISSSTNTYSTSSSSTATVSTSASSITTTTSVSIETTATSSWTSTMTTSSINANTVTIDTQFGTPARRLQLYGTTTLTSASLTHIFTNTSLTSISTTGGPIESATTSDTTTKSITYTTSVATSFTNTDTNTVSTTTSMATSLTNTGTSIVSTSSSITTTLSITTSLTTSIPSTTVTVSSLSLTTSVLQSSITRSITSATTTTITVSTISSTTGTKSTSTISTVTSSTTTTSTTTRSTSITNTLTNTTSSTAVTMTSTSHTTSTASTVTTTSATSSTLTSSSTTSSTVTSPFPPGSDMIKGFFAFELDDCSNLDTPDGHRNLSQVILAMASSITSSGESDLVELWEERGIHVLVKVDCSSHLMQGALPSEAQARVNYSIILLEDAQENVEDMTRMIKNLLAIAEDSLKSHLQNWGHIEVSTVLSFTEPRAAPDDPCPGAVPCSGQGACNRMLPSEFGKPSRFCSCNKTYIGPACSTRECPQCQEGTICKEGDQELSSIWACMCPNNCSGGGDCDPYSGICSCYTGYKEKDCSVAPLKRVPLASCVEVSLIWGLKGYTPWNKTNPDYDDHFDFFDPAVQEFIHDTCNEAMFLRGELAVREEQPCWIDVYSKYVANVGGAFPVVNRSEGSVALQSFMHYSNWWREAHFQDVLTREDQILLPSFKSDVETAGQHFSGRVRYVRVRMRSNMAVTHRDRKDLRKHWQEFVKERNKVAPLSAGDMLMVGDTWARMSLEEDISNGVVIGLCVSLGGSLIVVMSFLRSLTLMALAIFNIMLVVCVVAGFLLGVQGYDFGPVEMISSTMLVGMGVDYALHLAHGYKQHKEDRNKTEHAVKKYGMSILGGAMTTAIGVFVLTRCKMILFQKLGWALSSNAFFSAAYTFLFLAPMLRLRDGSTLEKTTTTPDKVGATDASWSC
eukprot:TRINITY_DN33291_c0_g1_i1.p1 TRINITY_DN33291_c0_g1~~TRINITY_DN33291_c0_g1_i1.p1  ORF type:complete len:1585 (-),score=181.45 TRINITY_DN33291_c0_g1_i1:134-4867(-)